MHLLRSAALATALLSLMACTTRPFQPSPPLYTLWAKPGVNEAGVRSAMLGCGFVHAGYVDGTTMTSDDYARAQLCMIDNGFVYQDRRIVCTDNPDLPACANVPRGKTFGTDPDFDPTLLKRRPSRPPAYTYWSRPGTDTEGVKRAMAACGYSTVIEPVNTMLLNDIAAAELCMIDKQFTYALPANALLCKNPPALPACRNRVIDAVRCCAPQKAAGQR
ncbi:hypothetical protein [Cupriavidus metallidurans]|uniref:hypothetical protein n=1 Tax=Cupriavidus metallidurans TaxID=119219 RepID=UPI003D0270AF